MTTVDNSARSTNPASNATQWNNGTNAYACANTQDYVFLLSEQEVTNAAYGFSSIIDNKDTARCKQTMDYAKCQGAYASGDEGNGTWWLRSPNFLSNYSNYAHYVSDLGRADDSSSVYSSSLGVVPALKIRL